MKRSKPEPGAPARAAFRVRANVWRYPGKGGWYFVNLSRAQSRKIREDFGPEAAGWGSLPVTVRIGGTTWHTSLFPDRKSGTYLFAIKASVRNAERIAEGDRVVGLVEIR